MQFIKEKTFRIRSEIENCPMEDGDAPEITDISPSGFFKILSETDLVISYTERSEGGKVEVDIKVSENGVTVSRRGDSNSDMSFSEGEITRTLYSVGAFKFDVEIFTSKIRNNLTRAGGKLDIYYKMDFGGMGRSVKMKIEVPD